MKPVVQTDLTFKTGNCGEACIASILEIPLSDIPIFHNSEKEQDGETYCRNLRKFVQQFGLSYIDVEFNDAHDPKDFLKDCWVVATGPSPRGTEEWHKHAVVWRNGDIVHDPHPSNKGLNKIDLYGFFIVGDPSRWSMRACSAI